MDVSLTPELDAFVQSKLASGQYDSVSEVVGKALRLMEEHDEKLARDLLRFQQEIQSRLDSLDRGEGRTPEELKCHFHEKAVRRRQLMV